MKDTDNMTEQQEKIYKFLLEYGFQIQKRSGCSCVGLAKDFVMASAYRLDSRLKEAECQK